MESKMSQHWAMYRGDCCELIQDIPDEKIGFSIFSPPFSSMYCYSDEVACMSNCEDDSQFFDHFAYLVPELLRVTKPGRLCSVHCMQLPSTKQHNGYIGIRDFRGEIIRTFVERGWIYHSEVCIWKDPVTAMQRTKAIGLLHKQIVKDSCMSRMGLADYVVTFRKPGVNPEPVAGEFTYYVGDDPPKQIRHLSIDIWQKYASPVWSDIDQSDTLNYRMARDSKDERHICLASGSLILTKQHGHRPIEDVEVGDLVLTHKGRWRKVIAKENTGINSTVSVNAQGVPALTLTPTHKVWAKQVGPVNYPRTKAVKTEPDWVEAVNLNHCYVNLKLPEVETPSETSDLIWWIVGRWIADGHIDLRNVAHISCGSHKMEELLNTIGDIAGNARCPGPTCFQVPLKDRDFRIRNIIKHCGNLAHNKKLPAEAFSLPKELAASLLAGYLSGDGYYLAERNRWYVSSVSRELLLGLKFLVQRVYGCVASIHKARGPRTKEIQGRVVRCKQEWVMSWGGVSHSFSFVDHDGAWKKVKSVTPSIDQTTWNLQVEEDESYTAEGCVVKNCPLQKQVIERCLQLWSNPGDTVLSPFAGIGSEGYMSVKLKRRFIGFELKPSYFKYACKHLKEAEQARMVKRLIED